MRKRVVGISSLLIVLVASILFYRIWHTLLNQDFYLLLLREGVDPVYTYDARNGEPDRYIVRDLPEEAVRQFLDATGGLFPLEGGKIPSIAAGSGARFTNYEMDEVRIIVNRPGIVEQLRQDDPPWVVAYVTVRMDFVDSVSRTFIFSLAAYDRDAYLFAGPGFWLGDWQLISAEPLPNLYSPDE
jgi:hypothetical protein